MGIQSDKEICQLIGGNDPIFLEEFAPTLEECAKLGIFTKKQALEYVGSKVKQSKRIMIARKTPVMPST
jgi:DNA-directed RNA polymerase III subunit RPC2